MDRKEAKPPPPGVTRVNQPIPRLSLGTMVRYEVHVDDDRFAQRLGMIVGTYHLNGLGTEHVDHYGEDPTCRESEGSLGYLVLGEHGLRRIHYGMLHLGYNQPVKMI